MSRVEVIGDATLYLGNSLEIMQTLKADHVIGDPPYEKEAHKVGRRTQASVKTGVNVDLDFDAITEAERDESSRLAVECCDGWLIFFCQAEAAGYWRDSIEAAKGKYKRTMIWVKPDSTPQLNGMMPAPGYESMPLAWCGKGKPHWNGGGKRGVFTHLTNNPEREGTHPTEKPLSLMRELITLFSASGQTILDPFMGSGTTGVACLQLRRKFIGIEMNEAYFDLACRRIEQASRNLPIMMDEPKRKAINTPDIFA